MRLAIPSLWDSACVARANSAPIRCERRRALRAESLYYPAVKAPAGSMARASLKISRVAGRPRGHDAVRGGAAVRRRSVRHQRRTSADVPGRDIANSARSRHHRCLRQT